MKKKKDKKIEVASLYDLNKQVISQLPEMPQEKIQEQLAQIEEWFSKKEGKYFMLLCREKKADYTLFNFNGKEIPDIFSEFINKASEDAWELWIKDFFNKEINMYMLFECGQMVIEI